MSSETHQTHFGSRKVRIDAKQGLVDDVFHKVADRYDLMNDLMSLGLHRVWKDLLVAKVRPPRRRPFAHLDVAGGTGDVAFRVAAAGGRRRGDGRRRQRRHAARRRGARASGAGGSACPSSRATPRRCRCPTTAFDAYTIAFGIRNVPRIDKALAEAYRVLKRGGRFLCLEFSRVDTPVLDRLYDAYSMPPFRRSAESSPATARPIATSSNRSGNFRRPSVSPT